MKMAPKPDSAEVRFRQSVTRVQQPLPGCMVVSVISLKGDAGKTSTTLTLANTFGSHRHGVVAWDANQSTGTLGDRAANPTDPDVGPWDVLENARDLTSAGACQVRSAGSCDFNPRTTKSSEPTLRPHAIMASAGTSARRSWLYSAVIGT